MREKLFGNLSAFGDCGKCGVGDNFEIGELDAMCVEHFHGSDVVAFVVAHEVYLWISGSFDQSLRCCEEDHGLAICLACFVVEVVQGIHDGGVAVSIVSAIFELRVIHKEFFLCVIESSEHYNMVG